MTETVLVAYDGSPLARRALAYALRKCPDDGLVVLHVLDPVYAVYEAELRGTRTHGSGRSTPVRSPIASSPKPRRRPRATPGA